MNSGGRERLEWAFSQVSYCCYSPSVFNPLEGQKVVASVECLREDLQCLRPWFNGLITYGLLDGLDQIPAVARRVTPPFDALILGVWYIDNQEEIERAIQLANQFPELVVALCAGNEGIYFDRYGLADVQRCLQDLRLAVPSETGLTTSEPLAEYLKSPGIIDCDVDFLAPTVHTWFDFMRDLGPVAAAERAALQVKTLQARAARPVLCKETGWPSGGAPGATPEAQRDFWHKLFDVAPKSPQIAFAAFEAFNAGEWKQATNPSDYPVEPHWGFFESPSRAPKPVVHAVPPLPAPAPQAPVKARRPTAGARQHLVVWLLTTESTFPFKTVLPRFKNVEFVCRDDLYHRYGSRVAGYNSQWDIWRWPVFRECLRLAREEGHLPDLLEHGTTCTIALADEYLCDLSRLATSTDVNAAGTFLYRSLRSCYPEDWHRNAGRYFALPFTMDCRILFFRRPFTHQNLSTWQSLEGAIPDLKRKGARWALQTGPDGAHDALIWILSSGGNLYSENLGVEIATEASVQGVMHMVRLAVAGIIPLGDTGLQNLDAAGDGIVKGEFHAGVAGYWLYNRLYGRDAAGDPLVKKSRKGISATLPPGDKYRLGLTLGTNLGVVHKYGHDVEHPDYVGAVALLKALTLDEFVLQHGPEYKQSYLNLPAWQYNELNGTLPPQLRIWYLWQQDKSRGSQFGPFSSVLLGPDSPRLPSMAVMAEVEEELKVCFQRLWERVGHELKKPVGNELKGRALKAREAACEAIVREELGNARKFMEQQGVGMVRVRVRLPNVSHFTSAAQPMGRAEVAHRYPASQFDLIVDEANGTVYVRPFKFERIVDGTGQKPVQVKRDLKPGEVPIKEMPIQLSSLPKAERNLLLWLVRSETGRINLFDPSPSRFEMMGAFASMRERLNHPRPGWTREHLTELVRELVWEHFGVKTEEQLAELFKGWDLEVELPKFDSMSPVEEWIRTIEKQMQSLDAKYPMQPVRREIAKRRERKEITEQAEPKEITERPAHRHITDALHGLYMALGVRLVPDEPGRPRNELQIPTGIGICHILPLTTPPVGCPVCDRPL